MKVFILDHGSAKEFVPDKPTLAIRIYDSPAICDKAPPGNSENCPLQPSKNWINIFGYLFDDFDLTRYPAEYVKEKLSEWESKFVIMDRSLAEKIISDFSGYCDIEQVMIHCTWGWARSPATILGLQKIFGLNIEWAKGRTQRVIEARKLAGSKGNSHVYRLLTETKLNSS